MTYNYQNRLPTRSAARGLTLIELMIAMVLSLVVVGLLLALYVNVVRTNNEMAKMNRLIENGRFATMLLQNDLAHAGFWSDHIPQFEDRAQTAPNVNAPTAEPDPCLATASWTPEHINNLIGIPVQSGTGTCVLTDQQAGTHALVTRYAEPITPALGSLCALNQTCFQVSRCASEINAIPSQRFVLGTGGFSLRTMACDASPPVPTTAPVRRLVSHVYYIRDDFTLMRSEFLNSAHQAAQPLIDGIEGFRVEYGIDNIGKNGNPVSYAVGAVNRGDGVPNTYVTCAPCTAFQLANVVAVKIHVLVRSDEPTPGYTDNKVYTLGNTGTMGPFNDGFKRHLLTTTIRLVNPSGRRETP